MRVYVYNTTNTHICNKFIICSASWLVNAVLFYDWDTIIVFVHILNKSIFIFFIFFIILVKVLIYY